MALSGVSGCRPALACEEPPPHLKILPRPRLRNRPNRTGHVRSHAGNTPHEGRHHIPGTSVLSILSTFPFTLSSVSTRHFADCVRILHRSASRGTRATHWSTRALRMTTELVGSRAARLRRETSIAWHFPFLTNSSGSYRQGPFGYPGSLWRCGAAPGNQPLLLRRTTRRPEDTHPATTAQPSRTLGMNQAINLPPGRLTQSINSSGRPCQLNPRQVPPVRAFPGRPRAPQRQGGCNSHAIWYNAIGV